MCLQRRHGIGIGHSRRALTSHTTFLLTPLFVLGLCVLCVSSFHFYVFTLCLFFAVCVQLSHLGSDFAFVMAAQKAALVAAGSAQRSGPPRHRWWALSCTHVRASPPGFS